MRRKEAIRPERIDSAGNPRIKHLIRLGNHPGNTWMIEGHKLVQEALSSGVALDEVFVTSEFSIAQAHRELLSRLQCRIFVLPPKLMTKISTLETPPGILALADRIPAPERVLPQNFAAGVFSLRDPGNLGTMIRSAEAAGCEFLACTKDCANPNSSKVIRASMGSIFRVPLPELTDGYLEWLLKKGIKLYALDARGGSDVFRITPVFPAMILIGSESHGLPANLPSLERIAIPMNGKVESLNAAMAATLCFYHFSRFL